MSIRYSYLIKCFQLSQDNKQLFRFEMFNIHFFKIKCFLLKLLNYLSDVFHAILLTILCRLLF